MPRLYCLGMSQLRYMRISFKFGKRDQKKYAPVIEWLSGIDEGWQSNAIKEALLEHVKSISSNNTVESETTTSPPLQLLNKKEDTWLKQNQASHNIQDTEQAKEQPVEQSQVKSKEINKQNDNTEHNDDSKFIQDEDLEGVDRFLGDFD